MVRRDRGHCRAALAGLPVLGQLPAALAASAMTGARLAAKYQAVAIWQLPDLASVTVACSAVVVLETGTLGELAAELRDVAPSISWSAMPGM